MTDLDDFLAKPGFARLWPAVRRKFVKLGYIGGRVQLTDVTDDEREALAGLLAQNLHGVLQLRVALPVVDEALRASRFAVSLADCLARLYPTELTPARDLKTAESERFDAFVAWAKSQAQDARLQAWIDTLGRRHADGVQVPGYRSFLRCYQDDREGDTGHSHSLCFALRALDGRLQALDASDNAPGIARAGAVRLPVLAAAVTGDPHGFDPDTLAGRVLLWGLVWLDGRSGSSEEATAAGGGAEETAASLEAAAESAVVEDAADEWVNPLGAEPVRRLFVRYGVTLDDVSSTVWVAGWPGLSLYPSAVTLWTLEQMERTGELAHACAAVAVAGAQSPGFTVFAVENPSIFGAIVDTARDMGLSLPHPLVCVSGQPSIAALRLFDAAVQSGGVVAYGGDMDLKGLQIAAGLTGRYRDRLKLWRMQAGDYARGVHADAPTLSDAELQQIMQQQLPGDSGALGQAMARHRVKVFQEHLADDLAADYWTGQVTE